MKKIYYLIMMLAIVVSCSKDDNKDNPTPPNPKDPSIEELIEMVKNAKYSDLKPSEQRVKLEEDGKDLLKDVECLKNNPGIDVFENLEHILDSHDIFNDLPSNIKTTWDLFIYANLKGTYTWNSTKNKWDLSNENSTAKLIFPAKKGSKTNNAEINFTVTGSGRNHTFVNEECDYTEEEGYVCENIENTIELPKTVNAILVVDNKKVAVINYDSDYSGSNQSPDKAALNIIFDNCISITVDAKKGTPNEATVILKNGNKILVDGYVNNTTILEDLFEDEDVNGKFSTLTKIKDNLLFYAYSDIELSEKEDEIYEKYNDLREKLNDNNKKEYYEKISDLNKKESKEYTDLTNLYSNAALFAKGDSTKIASVFEKSEVSYIIRYKQKEYNGNEYWEWDGYIEESEVVNADNLAYYREYQAVSYLRFGDNVEVEADAYFSEFVSLKNKIEDFIKAFER